MAEKIVIEVYRNKNTDELTKLIADPDSKLDTGSGAAVNCAVAASFLQRAAALTAKSGVTGEKIDYVVKNTEILRNYMVFLIDEDIKSKNPMRQAVKSGDPNKIDACRHPAIEISEEIINMVGNGLELAKSLAEICSDDAKYYIAQYIYTAMAAAKTCASYIVGMTAGSPDETFKFVSKRENEMTVEQFETMAGEIMEKIK